MDADDTVQYLVVINHEEQYSIWPADRALPTGWSGDGFSGTKEECLAHIDRVWTDMRPLSLRRALAKPRPPAEPAEDPFADLPDLVDVLSAGKHPVRVALRPEPTVAGFAAALDRGYVHLVFTDTQGGTELGVPVAPADVDRSEADFDAASGRVRLSGELTLDFTAVRCTAEIALPALTGWGQLVPAAAER